MFRVQYHFEYDTFNWQEKYDNVERPVVIGTKLERDCTAGFSSGSHECSCN